jgi:hypothetical protein
VTCDQRRGTDGVTAGYIERTSRACPHCTLRATHFRGHQCHHIVCPACRGRWCYNCGQPSEANGNGHRCDTPRCRDLVFCGDGCTCPDCPDCKPGQPCRGEMGCPNDGRCRVCQPRR